MAKRQNRPTNPKRDDSNVPSVTTESLGLGEAKAKELIGALFTCEDIQKAVVATLVAAGISMDDIRSVRAGCDSDHNPRIIAEVKYSALVGSSAKSNWWEIDDSDDDDNRVSLNGDFVRAMRNKMFYKHFKNRVVNKPSRKGGKKKFIQLEIDPEIFIAFAFNFDYTDEVFAIKCNSIPFLSGKEMDMRYDSKKKQNAYKNRKNEYIADKMSLCEFIVISSLDYSRLSKMKDCIIELAAKKAGVVIDPKSVISDEDFDKLLNRTLTSGDFHPNQVIEIKEDEKETKKNGKKKKK